MNYNQALATIQYLEKKYPEVKRIVSEFEQQQAALNGQNLHSFLVIPVQRIPRYILLLKVESLLSQDCEKYTPDQHPDYAALQDAISQLDVTLKKMNSNINADESSRMQKLLDIAQSIEGEQVWHYLTKSASSRRPAGTCGRVL